MANHYKQSLVEYYESRLIDFLTLDYLIPQKTRIALKEAEQVQLRKVIQTEINKKITANPDIGKQIHSELCPGAICTPLHAENRIKDIDQYIIALSKRLVNTTSYR